MKKKIYNTELRGYHFDRQKTVKPEYLFCAFSSCHNYTQQKLQSQKS